MIQGKGFAGECQKREGLAKYAKNDAKVGAPSARRRF